MTISMVLCAANRNIESETPCLNFKRGLTEMTFSFLMPFYRRNLMCCQQLERNFFSLYSKALNILHTCEKD